MNGAERQFDVVVIGSGMGGLTAGSLAARSGKKVLVLEKNPTCGGAAGVYDVGGLTIESSLHEMDGLDAGDPKMPILDRLAVPRSVPFVGVRNLWEVRSPLLEEPFVMPEGLDAALEVTSARFPAHAAALEQYFERIHVLRDALASAVYHQRDPRWWIRRGGRKLWPFIRQSRMTLGHVLDKLFGDDEAIKLALCANLIYYTDDPDRMWFPHWSVAQASYHRGGGHYPRGGSKQLAEYLAEYIREAGGQIENSRRVTRILTDEGRVTGVEHTEAGADHGAARREMAPLVFGNAAPHALEKMLPEAVRGAFMKPYRDRPVSLSLYTIALGFDRRPSELGVENYSTSVFSAPLGATAASGSAPGRPPAGEVPHYIFVDYSAVDTGLTEGAPFLGTITGVDRVENWQGLSGSEYEERRERFIDYMVGALDQQFRGISSAVVQRSMTTATGAADYLGTPEGAIYGFAPERRQQVVDPKTKVDGLWLTSAYVGLGGYSGAIIGSSVAVKSALRESWRDWEGA